jgi:RNA polymerase sigma factor (sigma-70 family)
MAKDDTPISGTSESGDGGEESGTAPRKQPPRAELAEVEVLLLSEYDRLLALIRKHLPRGIKPPVEAIDVLQDTYFQAFRQVAQLNIADDTSVIRFLSTIARRRIAALIRRSRLAKRIGVSEDSLPPGSRGDDPVAGMLAALASHRRTPSRSAAAHEFMRAVEDSLSRLPDAQRTAVTMRYVEGSKPEEIARAMGRTVPAVHQLCNRGLNAIRIDLRSASHFLY